MNQRVKSLSLRLSFCWASYCHHSFYCLRYSHLILLTLYHQERIGLGKVPTWTKYLYCTLITWQQRRQVSRTRRGKSWLQEVIMESHCRATSNLVIFMALQLLQPISLLRPSPWGVWLALTETRKTQPFILLKSSIFWMHGRIRRWGCQWHGIQTPPWPWVHQIFEGR